MKKVFERTTISEVYLHINNGGVKISVVDDEAGPALVTESMHFGHTTGGMRIMLDLDGLQKLRDMFQIALEHGGYSKDYCLKAKAMLPEDDEPLSESNSTKEINS